jgi:hypothetical protein
MNTTNLFVEVIVIGTGALIYIALLSLTIFGCEPFVNLLTSIEKMQLGEMSLLVSAVPAFSVIYVLGIVTDRIANKIFDECYGAKLETGCFPNDSLFKSRHTIYTQAGYLSTKLEYGRSRLRVCRGWTLNFVLIAVSMILFLYVRLPDQAVQLGVIAVIVFGTLAAATGWTWYQLIKTEYAQVKAQAKFLSEQATPKDLEIQKLFLKD